MRLPLNRSIYNFNIIAFNEDTTHQINSTNLLPFHDPLDLPTYNSHYVSMILYNNEIKITTYLWSDRII